MKNWQHLILTLALLCGLPYAACHIIDPVTPPPIATGGTPSAGGATAAGGTVATGGKSATGGTTATTVTEIQWLECKASARASEDTSYRRLLSGWKPTPARQKAMRAKAKVAYTITSPSVFWGPNVKTPLEQWIGSCTGHSAAQHLSTQPFTALLSDDDAMRIYSLATVLDPFAGEYPPDDTGSNTSSAARAAKILGYTTRDYYAVETLEGLQQALQRSSCVMGTPWYQGFSRPTACGEMLPLGIIEGGHAKAIVAWDANLKRVITRNSWGKDWGNCRKGDPDECGYAYWSAGTFLRLLREGAEIDCPRMD